MSQIIHAKDLRPGNTFIYKNNLYLVIENSFNKTAMREGIVKCKVKRIKKKLAKVPQERLVPLSVYSERMEETDRQPVN